MSSLAPILTTYAINAAWQAPLLAAAAWILTRAFGRTTPELQHKIWVIALMLAILVPATPMIHLALPDQATLGSPRTFPSVIPAAATELTFAAAQIALPGPVIDLVAGLHSMTLLFFAARIYRMIRTTRDLVRNSTSISPDSEYDLLWQQAKAAFNVRTAVLACSPRLPAPATASLVHPTVLLPCDSVQDFSHTEFLAAVGHECAHIQRRDFWKNLAYESLALVIDFHPIAWFIKSQIAHTRELICDALTAERLLDRQAYALSLLQLARRMPLSLPAFSCHSLGLFDIKTLEVRIMTLTTPAPSRGPAARLTTAAAATLLLCGCALTIGSLTQTVTAQTSATAKGSKAQKAKRDLSCTYWSPDNKANPGTCALDKKDKSVYRCYSDVDPALSNIQTACQSKLLKR